MSNNLISLLLVSIFKNIINDGVVKSYIELIDALNNKNFIEALKKYSEFINILYDNQKSGNIYEYIKQLIYKDNNLISQGCSDCIKENEQILETAGYELSLFETLLTNNYSKIKSIFESKFPENTNVIEHLPVFYSDDNPVFVLEDILESYKTKGYGIFSCYNAFKFDKDKKIIPVKYFDNITFNELKNYKYQQDILKKNTLAFLNGKEANNILLYGDRGCGKSSSVKALINEFADYNIKIIQIFKDSFIYLNELYEIIRKFPNKFIIFADDISFDENDKYFSSVKAALEGTITQKPKNTLIYATTNRIHLVKENFSSRNGNEIHLNDTIDETVSLSDRFGIILTFSLLNQSEYLDIVEKIANDCCIEINDNLRKKALEFSIQKGIRTPRVARQFITDYIAML